MRNELRIFHVKRQLALFGLGAMGASVSFAFLNAQFAMVAQSTGWLIVVGGLVLAIAGTCTYRYPSCAKMPESDDVPLFDPSACDHCGRPLK